MMRALKSVALAVFAIAVVAAVALIAAWPLGATPSAAAPQIGGRAIAPGQYPSSIVNGWSAAVPVTAPTPAPSAALAGPVGGRTGPGDPGDGPVAVPVTTVTSPGTSHPRTGENPSPQAAVAHAARLGIRQSAIVLDRDTGTVLVQSDPTLPMPSMSLVKLFIAVDLLDRSGGPDALDPTTAERLWQMITVSDDRAASALWIQGGDGAIVQRIAARFGLTAVAPPTNPGMWGDTTVTAGDLARFLCAALSDPSAGPWLAHAMESAANTGADGFDQNFGMNTVTGAGSKQGWGCCLRGVRSLDSAGFADGRIVVVLSSAPPDVSDATMRAALTATVQAAVRG